MCFNVTKNRVKNKTKFNYNKDIFYQVDTYFFETLQFLFANCKVVFLK